MLGRAAKSYESSAPPKNDLAKQLFPSSSPAQNGNIGEQFKKARSSQSSMTGFTNYKNNTHPLGPKSPNDRVGTFRKSGSTASATSSLGMFLSRDDSFQDGPDMFDLTREVQKKGNSNNTFAVEFDENDFDDDEDLDLDYEMPSVLPMAAPPKPPRNSEVRSQDLPKLPTSSTQRQSSQAPPSSTTTWSSSSPSHKITPPGAVARRQREQVSAQQAALENFNPDPDPNPRPCKRRTLPWAQQKGEADELAARQEELDDQIALVATQVSSQPAVCFKCKQQGHYVKNCPNKGSVWERTPQPKDKSMPWNTTASALKEQKSRKKRASTKSDQNTGIAAVESTRRKQVVVAPIKLSQEQETVRDLVVNQNKSVFFTGSAGTGKSVLMRAIIMELRKKYIREPDRIAVTASTGLAACNIGGVTLHSFGGIGLGKEDVPALVKKIKRNAKAKQRWLRTKVLIIDEISMVDGDLFDKLEGIARAMRNNGRSFGGIQLVITGDFFQLPPVPDWDNKSREAKFAFDAGTWSTAIHHIIGLTEVFRQKDPVFANMLNEMRLGKITAETLAAFKSLSRKINYEDSLDATELFPTRNEVENSNAFRMRDLHGKSYKYVAEDRGTADEAQRERLLSNMMAPKLIELKKGAQVMLIKNMDDGLVNGSLGKVVAFLDEITFNAFDDDPDVLNEAIESEALSDASREARQKIEASKNSGKTLYPYVQFLGQDGSYRSILIKPEDWKVELPSGEVQASRNQLPLILAWALSIHKAQGQTLERVKIDLKKVFEKGQAYVALSRATTQEGLEVQNFDPKKVMAHPRVAQFYDSLYSANKALKHPKVSKAPLEMPTKEKSNEKGKGAVRARDFGEGAMAAYT